MPTKQAPAVKCVGTVRSGFRARPCGKRASVERDGAAYCRVHDPDRAAERREATDERVRLHMATAEARHAVKRARSNLADVVLGLSDATLATLPGDVQSMAYVVRHAERAERTATKAMADAGVSESAFTRVR